MTEDQLRRFLGDPMQAAPSPNLSAIYETPEQRAKRIGVPYISPRPAQQPYVANPVVAVCGGCGRDVHCVEGYVCPQSNCPMTARSNWSQP